MYQCKIWGENLCSILDQVEVTIVHGHLEQCRRITSIGKRDFRLLNGSFNLNLHLITRTLTNGLEKIVCLGDSKKTMGWGWDGTQILT
jgi:hypothetical protein